jgi:hypothetical protein
LSLSQLYAKAGAKKRKDGVAGLTKFGGGHEGNETCGCWKNSKTEELLLTQSATVGVKLLLTCFIVLQYCVVLDRLRARVNYRQDHLIDGKVALENKRRLRFMIRGKTVRI